MVSDNIFHNWNKAFEKSVLNCYEPNIGLFLGGADSSAIALCLADHKLPFLSVTCLNNPKSEDLDTLQAVINYTKEYNNHSETKSYKKLTPFIKQFLPHNINFSPFLSCIDILDTKVFMRGYKMPYEPESYAGTNRKATYVDLIYNITTIAAFMNVSIKYPYVNEEILLAVENEMTDKDKSLLLSTDYTPLMTPFVKQYLIDRNIPIPKIKGRFSDQWKKNESEDKEVIKY